MDDTSSPVFATRPRRAIHMNDDLIPPPWSPSPLLGRSMPSSPHADRSDTVPPLENEHMASSPPPAYSNSLRLATLCQRKKEFKSAFEKVHRGQRRWEVVWLVLDGTLLRVYAPTKEERKSLEERYTLIKLTQTARPSSPRGTIENPPPRPAQPTSHLSPLHRAHTVHDPSPLGRPMLIASSTRDNQEGTGNGSSSLQTHRRTTSIVKVADDLQLAPITQRSQMGSIANHSAPLLVHATRPIFPTVPTPDFSKRTACRQYGTRNATCSRPEGYIKREHVLRFTLNDGKQFLVQLNSKSEMISWLQCMSVAAPLALDIDERPMPEPAHYPRTRRRALELTGAIPRRPRTAPAALGSASRPAAAPAYDGTSETQDDNDHEIEEDIDEALDHLPSPPPRRPPAVRSLSSVEHARRMGIQL